MDKFKSLALWLVSVVGFVLLYGTSWAMLVYGMRVGAGHV